MRKNRIIYSVVFIYALVLFLFYHNFFFFYMLLVVAVLPFISWYTSKRVWQKTELKAKVHLLTVGSGNDIPVEFTTVNPSLFPLPGIKAEFIVENHFYPNTEVQEINLPIRKGNNTFTWNIKSVYAGRVSIKGKETTVQDYLGLVLFRRRWDCELSVSVVPPESDVIMNVIETALTDGDEQERDNAAASEDVTQIKQFREYIPGDRMQRVNWKISAKHENLYVKEFEKEYNQTLTLLVELRRDREETGFLDELITAFYSAAVKLLEMEIKFRVQWYDCETQRFMTENVEEPDSLLYALQQMYLMQSYTEYYAFEQYKELPHGKNDLTVYFTSPSFGAVDDSHKIGTYKESVSLICL